jgi:hypothetical protein
MRVLHLSTELIFTDACTKVTGTNDGGRVLDACAQLLSRALVSQSASESRRVKHSSYFKREADAICKNTSLSA